MYCCFFFFFKQKTAYEIYQCDWSSDVCSSDLANIGQWSSSYVSQSHSRNEHTTIIICFEPSEYTYRKLKKNLNSLTTKNIEFISKKLALSNEEGNTELAIVHDGAGTNSLVTVPGGYIKKEAIKKITLDKYLVDNKIEKVHLLKIDAEGHDFDVIYGAQKALLSNNIEVIQFEYNWRWIYGRHFLRDAFELLSGYGYKIGKITPKGIQFQDKYIVELESFVEANYIACTVDWKSRFKNVAFM